MARSVILGGARTPMGKLLGSLKDFSAAQLGTVAIRATLERSGVRPEQVQYTIMGEGPFFGLLKAEIGTAVWESREAARADVFRFIEVEYNRTRLRRHPEFGYLTPLETRAGLQQDLTPAA